MEKSDHLQLRKLLDEYLEMYASRDDRLTSRFSEDFSGFTGGGAVLVKDREKWVAITRQDFAQVKDAIRIELKDFAIQSLADTVAVVTSFFTIHLPIPDHILSRETARLVLIFKKEAAGWQIVHSSISIPYHLVREGEIYPLRELVERNRFLEELTAERTRQQADANESLTRANAQLASQIAENVRAAERLRESEALYRSIMNASPDDITIADLEGRILMVSPAAVTMFGFDYPEQGLGRSLLEFIVPEDRARAASTIGLIIKGLKKGPGEYRGVRGDGFTFDIEVNSDLIRDREGRPSKLMVIVRDISARKAAEAALRESEEKYRTLVERANEGIVILQGGAFVFANRKMAEILGLSVEALAGRPFIEEFIWPEDRERVSSNHARRIAGEPAPSDYDFRVIGAGGQETWVFLSATQIHWKGSPATLALVTDITERKRSEEALRRAHDQIRTLRGLHPICMHCKKIRDAEGRWSPVEVYIRQRTEAEFSHGLCPECLEKRYPEGPDDEGEGGGNRTGG